jgi:hypothetical protein
VGYSTISPTPHLTFHLLARQAFWIGDVCAFFFFYEVTSQQKGEIIQRF